jgi:dTDP-4-dehydrorhamnose reductase
MRILLTGASGFLGNTLITLLCRYPDVELTVARTSHAECPLPLGAREVLLSNLAESAALRAELKSRPPTHIIHTAALSNPTTCEQDPAAAHLSNTLFTKMLAEYAGNVGAHLTYTSTDLVFDGAPPPKSGFQEEDLAYPLSHYAITKEAAERETLAVESSNAVIRLSLLYGYSLSPSRGVLGWMEDLWLRGEPVTLFSDEYRTPIHVTDAAYAVLQVAFKRLSGILHCGGPERLSRVEFGCQVADALGYDSAEIRPCLRSQVNCRPLRPEDVSLDSSKLNSLISFTPRTVASALNQALDPRKSA